MSWLKFNDSFNSLKGQLSNLMQEGIGDDENDNNDPANRLIEANKKVDELTDLCTTQDVEITTLRRQITELLQQQQNHQQQLQRNAESTLMTKSTNEVTTTTAATLEDSWFWEPENNTSSSSSKNEEIISKSTSGGDLTNIPLDQTGPDSEIIDRLNRKLDEKEQKLKKINLENAILNEKIKQITVENKEINENIEELDKQHNMVIENLLQQKNELQEKCLKYQQQLDDNQKICLDEKKSQEELIRKNDILIKNFQDEKQKYEKIEQTYVNGVQENLHLKQKIETLEIELKKLVCENVDLTAKLELIDQEWVKKWDVLEREKNAYVQDFTALQDDDLDLQRKYHALKNDYENMQKLNTEQIEEFQKVQNNLIETQKKLNIVTENIQKVDEEKINLVNKKEQEINELQKELIDLQSQLNGKNVESVQQVDVKQDHILSLDDLKLLLKNYLNYEKTTDNAQKYLEDFLVTIKDLRWKTETLERRLTESFAECNTLRDNYKKLEHEKETLQADLMHYELECGDLMKNNEIILAEMESLKSGKLETIHENNEDLEKQLEDCNTLNRSLEDEYNELQQKLDENEMEKLEFLDKIKLLENDLQKKTNKCKELKMTIETLSSEKSNLLFEINELKIGDHTDDDNANEKTVKLEEELAKSKVEIETIQQQLSRLNLDHADLVGTMQQLQTSLVESKRNHADAVAKYEKEITAQNLVIMEKDNHVKNIETDLENLRQKVHNGNEENDENLMTLRREYDKLQQKYENDLSELRGQVAEAMRQDDELKKCLEEKEITCQHYLEKIKELESKLLEPMKDDNKDELANEINNLRQIVEGIQKEKNDLIALITVKHQENVQYHAEIQRLGQLVQMEMSKTATFTCPQCPQLQQEIEKLKLMTNRLPELDQMTDQMVFLREKSDILTTNLLIEQNNQKQLVKEKQELLEEKNTLNKDLERLRLHLLQIEEEHTHQTIELQRQMDEYKNKLFFMESDAQKSSNAYTSASIRANQHAETLQAQYLLLSQQRDEIASRLSIAEDRESKNQAALTNLQCALEQFQKDKDRDIEATTYRLRKQLDEKKLKYEDVLKEMKLLQQQLMDAKNGLLAASRISDQLEMSQATISAQKEELIKYQEKCSSLEKKIKEIESNQADKVEKSLIKNLIIGYVSAPNVNDKSQILKLISAVLDFNQIESDRIGLNKSQGGWLNSILQTATGTSGSDNYNKEGLAQAFVKFLEKESQPRNTSASLLNINHPSTQTTATTADQHSSVPASTSNSSIGPQSLDQRDPKLDNLTPVQPILLSENILQSLAPPRNSSSILKDILNDT